MEDYNTLVNAAKKVEQEQKEMKARIAELEAQLAEKKISNDKCYYHNMITFVDNIYKYSDQEIEKNFALYQKDLTTSQIVKIYNHTKNTIKAVSDKIVSDAIEKDDYYVMAEILDGKNADRLLDRPKLDIKNRITIILLATLDSSCRFALAERYCHIELVEFLKMFITELNAYKQIHDTSLSCALYDFITDPKRSWHGKPQERELLLLSVINIPHMIVLIQKLTVAEIAELEKEYEKQDYRLYFPRFLFKAGNFHDRNAMYKFAYTFPETCIMFSTNFDYVTEADIISLAAAGFKNKEIKPCYFFTQTTCEFAKRLNRFVKAATYESALQILGIKTD